LRLPVGSDPVSKCSFPDRVLYVQKREVLKVQRAEVERWFAKRLPECDLSFAVIGDRPTGSFDCVIAPAAASTFETIVGVKDLRWLHFMGAGVDAVAKEMEERTTVRFTTSAGVNADSIAEYVMGGILYFSKRLGEFDRYKGERRWQRHWLRELSGQRLLCLGVGAVGKAVAIRAKAFGMRVTGMARTIDGGGRASMR
jgi:phosphoglycerate dehydrogenase-like enzyme